MSGAITISLIRGPGYLVSAGIAHTGKSVNLQYLGPVVSGNVMGAIVGEQLNWVLRKMQGSNSAGEKKK